MWGVFKALMSKIVIEGVLHLNTNALSYTFTLQMSIDMAAGDSISKKDKILFLCLKFH